MSTITKDLGVVTAYGYYKAGGGTMTEAEFTQFMVDFGTASKTAVDAASAALESERAAKQSEETATRKASEAGESASTASTKAGEAAQSASDADTAKTDAVAAKTAAETAQGKAEDAQAVAEAVAESIPSDYSQLSEDVSDLKENLSDMNTATSADVGKALKAKTVTDGKVTEWEFGEAGGSVTVDSALDATSENPVQNKTLYNELNILTSSADDIVYINNGTNETSVYGGGIATIEFPTSNPLTLKEVDVCVASGNVAKLGIWSFRRYTEDTSSVSYNRGYFTLERVLGEVTASNNHAVFTLDNLSIDPTSTEQILIVSCATNKLGAHSNVVNNLAPMWYTSNYGFSETNVGEENSTLLWYKVPNGDYNVQPAYKATYTQGGTVTATPVKTVVQNLESDVSAINTATSADIGKALVVDSVTDGKATFAFESVGGGGSSDASGSAYTEGTFRTPVNKYFCVIVDDVTADALTVADQLLAIGVKPAFALKMESMGSEITWDNVKRLQDLGFEICFHGMLHSHTPAGTAPANDSVMIADIAEYKALCTEHGIVLHGYAGPNHYPLPVGAFKEFEWARTPYGLQGYGGGNHLTTTFASVIVWSCDPVNNAVPTSTMIAAANTLSDNQYLTPMLHCQNLVAYFNDYLTVFNSWISAGLTPLRPMDAVKQSLFNSGGIGNNSTFEIQAGTASNPYNMIAGNGIQHMDNAHGYYTKSEVDNMVGDVETLLASI